MVSVPVLHKAMGISLQQAEGQLSLQPVAEQLPPLQAMDEGQLSHQPIAQQQLSLQPLAEGQSSLQALMVDDNRNIVPTRNEQLTVSHSQQSMWEPVWDFLTIYGSRNETLQLQTKLANQASPPPTTGVNNPPKEFAPMYWLVLSTIIIFLTQKNLQTANWLHTEIPKPIVLCLQWSRNIHFTQEKKIEHRCMCYEIRCSLQNWKNWISIFLCRKQLHSQAPAASRSFRISVPPFHLQESPFQNPREGVNGTLLKTCYWLVFQWSVVLNKLRSKVQLWLTHCKLT